MPQKIPITRTKILVPQRRKEILSRPRLLDMLNDLLDYKLIIIAAPAGYGKTSLTIDFAHQFQWPVCWYALDALDQDPIRFVAHFITAIEERFPEFGQDSIVALENSSPDDLNLDFIIATIVNDIFDNITEHFILVLDDYHLINQGREVDQFISDFLQRVGENCHLVTNSRSLLTLPDLPLLVARAQVGGLGIEELGFLPEEIQNLYLQNFSHSLSKNEAQELAQQSEGWITGLLLTSQINQQGIGSRIKVARASGIGLYEYLAQQVLDLQSQEMKDFLLRSSLLEEFDAEMCQQVIGKALSLRLDWSNLMKNTIFNNLFVLRVGEEGLWLRYHHLFRDFLQERMHLLHQEEETQILTALANFFSEQENWEQVYAIYKKMGDFKRIIHLLERVGTPLMAKGKVHKLAEWFEHIPYPLIQENLKILSLRASVAVNLGDSQEGLTLLNEVLAKLQSQKDSPEKIAENLIRRSTANRILGKYQESLQDAENALNILQQLPDVQLLNAEAIRAKGIILFQQGNLAEARKWLKKSLKIYQEVDHWEDVARLQVELGAVNETLGDFQAAETAYKHALEFWRQSGDSIWQANLHNNLGVLQHSKGDFENSLFSLEKSMQYAQINGNKRMQGYSLASIGDLYKDLGAPDEALEAYRNAMEIAQEIEEQFLIFYIRLAIARINLIQQNIKSAESLIHSAHNIAKTSGSEIEINKCALERGILAFYKKDYPKAAENLISSKEYFTKQHQIEDVVFSSFYLALIYAIQNELDLAVAELDDLLVKMDDQSMRIPVLIAAAEINDQLRLLSNVKTIGKIILEFFPNLDAFQQEIQKTRRKIRKEASVVPIYVPRLAIHGFGKCEVYANGQLITSSDWMSQTSRDLFFLFLAFPEGLSKGEVGLYLWPELSPEELKLRFKNTLYRLRRAVGNEVVLFKDNYYQFNRDLDFEYDVANFLQTIADAEIEKNISTKMALLEKVVDLYQGPYLVNIDAAWVIPDQQRYCERYIQVLQELIQYLMDKGEYNRALQYVHKALQEDSSNEETYRLAMRIHFAEGNKGLITQQYEQCRKILSQEIDTEPSDATTQLYEQLMRG